MAQQVAQGTAERYRLVTRSDFDGLVCAALLKQLGMLDDILFVHPKDMQDGKVELSDRDITTNLPYVPGVHLAFDHHDSEVERVGESPDNHVIDPRRRRPRRAWCTTTSAAPSASRPSPTELMEAVDKADAAQFSEAEILEPTGWIFLSFLMDPRTGLGRFRDFRISNYELMMQLIDACTQLQRGGDPRHAGRRRARGALPRPRRPAREQIRALRDRAREPRRARPPRRGGHPPREPLPGLRAVPRVHRLDARAVGPAQAEHGLRGRQVDPRPLEPHRRRRAHARATAAAATTRPARARWPTRTPAPCRPSSSRASTRTADSLRPGRPAGGGPQALSPAITAERRGARARPARSASAARCRSRPAS